MQVVLNHMHRIGRSQDISNICDSNKQMLDVTSKTSLKLRGKTAGVLGNFLPHHLLVESEGLIFVNGLGEICFIA